MRKATGTFIYSTMLETEIQDIKEKINFDFGKNSKVAFAMLNSAIEKIEYLKTPRIIRSIVFLSHGKIEELEKNINVAINDSRDVMFWAEYENINDFENAKRIRDFNKTFENCKISVEE